MPVASATVVVMPGAKTVVVRSPGIQGPSLPGGIVGASGSVTLTQDVQTGAVTFASALSATPSQIILAVLLPNGSADLLFAAYHSPSASGFTYLLNSPPPASGYVLNYLAIP